MNVCLQSMLHCPAFYNMLIAIGTHDEIFEKLDPEGLLIKLVEVSRYFDEAN